MNSRPDDTVTNGGAMRKPRAAFGRSEKNHDGVTQHRPPTSRQLCVGIETGVVYPTGSGTLVAGVPVICLDFRQAAHSALYAAPWANSNPAPTCPFARRRSRS